MTPDRTHRPRWPLGVLAGLLVAVGGWWLWQRESAPEVPTIALDGADPAVAAAVEEAREAVRRDPRSADTWGRLGMTLMANAYEADSVAPFRTAEELNPTDPRWPYLAGVALVGKDPDAAIPCLRRAAAAAGDGDYRAAARLRLAETLAADGHVADAEAEFRAVSAGPLTPCAEYGLGALAALRGDLAAARDHLARCADSPYTRRRAAVQLAAIARRQGQAGSARVPPAEADAPWPDPVVEACLTHAAGKEGRLRRVTSLEQHGRADEALQELRSLARDYPEPRTWLPLGITLGRHGHFRESEEILRQCLRQQPDLVRAQYYLSLALLGQGEMLQQRGQSGPSAAKFEEAARWARRAIELTPHNGEAHFQLGLTEWARGHRAEAIAAFRRAVATRPDLGEAHYWLGKTLAADGQTEEAIVHLRNALAYLPENDRRPRQDLDRLLKGKGS